MTTFSNHTSMAGDARAETRGTMTSPIDHVIARTKEVARSWDLDLLLRTYLFIPRKILRDAVREFGSALEGRMLDVGCGAQQYRRFVKCQQYCGIEWDLAGGC
jgi:hypothetical protein